MLRVDERAVSSYTAAQVDWEKLSSRPFFSFNPSRAHGPRPLAAVPLDATPEFDRAYMFYPPKDASVDADFLEATLFACLGDEASSAWLVQTIMGTFSDFRNLHVDFKSEGPPADFRVALPTAAQLDKRCLSNCFYSTQRLRDVTLSQGFQQYGTRVGANGAPEVYHQDFMLQRSLPALIEHYSDWFVGLQVR